MILTDTYITIEQDEDIHRTPNTKGSVVTTIKEGRYRSIMHTSGEKHKGSTVYHLVMCSQGDYLFGWLHNSKGTTIDRFETLQESADYVNGELNKLKD